MEIENVEQRLTRTLRIENTIDDSDKELPELVIKELTNKEIEDLRENQEDDVAA